MQTIVSALALLRRLGQTLGPYLMVEILLPGGTLLAFLLFLYRRRAAVSSPQPLAAGLRSWLSGWRAKDFFGAPAAAPTTAGQSPGFLPSVSIPMSNSVAAVRL